MKKIHLVRFATCALASFALMSSYDNAYAKRRDSRAQVIRGIITNLSATTLVVNDTTIAISGGTKFEDFLGDRTTVDALAVGDCVKIKVRPGQPALTAREVELEDHCPTRSATPAPTPNGTVAPQFTPISSSTPIPTATRTGTPGGNDCDHHDDEGQDDSGHHGRNRHGGR